MAMDLSGKIVQVLPQEKGMGKKGQWLKQSFVIETQGQYPKKVCVTAWGDKVTEFNVKVGIEVKAYLELESREYNARWYTEARVWKMERTGGTAQEPAKSQTSNADPFGDMAGSSSETDDLPF
jgi:hypothetical protein